MKIISLLLRSRFLVLLVAAVAIAAGAAAWTRLPIDAFPDVTNTQVMIISTAPGLAAVDVEQRVSTPIEQLMGGLPRVKQVRSLSRAGLSQVVIVFEDGADTYWTRQVVFERLAMAREQLPPGVEAELGPISTGLGEVFQYTLESKSHDAMELRTIQDWLVAPRLKAVPGVNEVNSFGGFVKQYQVLVSPEKLLKYGLSATDVADAVARNNANAGGGVLVRGWEQTYLRSVGLVEGVPDLERIVLEADDGVPVLVRDVAQVVVDAEPRQGAVTRDGQGETVAGRIIMLKGENSQDVVSRSKEAVARIQQSLPEGVRIDAFYDRTALIEACIETVQDALLEGGVFVVLVLFLFVAELRTALVVLFSLPFTFLVSFIVMGWAGLSSTLMSLGGLAFSVGMVVDASIVVVENVRRHLALERERSERRRVVAQALAEVARPVAFSVLIIAIILVPLFTLQGIEGKMFAPLALTMLIALLVSLGVALTVVPVLSDLALRQAPEKEFGFVRRVHRGYLWLLDRAVRRPAVTLGLSIALLLGAAALVPFVGTEFMPPLDEGAIAINVVRLPNASLDGSVQVGDFIEERLRRLPEVETVVSTTGRAEISEDPMGPEQTDVFVMLKPRGEWTTGRTRAELVDAIQADLSQIPGVRLSFSQPIALRVNELIAGVKSDVAVKVFGPDLEVLREAANRMAAVIGEVEGSEDLRVEQVSGMAQLDIVLDREALARYGLNAGDVNEVIETAVAGRRVSTMIEDQQRFAIVVRLPEEARGDVEAIERLLIPAPNGERVPLDRVADLSQVESPAQVSRENGVRRVVIECNVRGRDLGGFIGELQARISPVVDELPSGYFVEYGGQFENQQRAMRQLSIVVPVALLVIFVLLFMALGSVKDSLLVLLNLPFALVGGIVAVVAFGMPFSVSAAVAFIVLLGIAVQNGVVLVAFFRQLRSAGRSVEETIREGCEVRFRPLLMTALTSFIGHLPMLYATGSGADIQKPLAVVVMGGLVTSTLLTLVVLPTIYRLVNRDGPPRTTAWAWEGRAAAAGVLLVIALATGGCGAGVAQSAPGGAIAEVTAAQASPRGSEPGNADVPVPGDGEAVSLDQVLAFAARNAPALHVARAEALRGDAEVVAASPLVPDNPEVSVAAGGRTVGSETGLELDVALSQRFEIAGERELRRETARRVRELALGSVHEAEWQVRGQVRGLFLAALVARERLELAEQARQFVEGVAAISRRRAEVGETSPVSAVVVEAEVAQARQALVEARQRELAARLELAEAAGWPVGARLVLRGDLPAVRRAPSVDDLVRNASERHPGLRALALEVRAAESRVKLEDREAWPEPTLGAGYAREPEGDGAAHVWSVEVGLPIPFWQRNQGERARARAELEVARAELEAAMLRLRPRLARAAAEVDAAAERIELLEAGALPAVERSLSLVLRAYEEGQIDILEVSQVRERLLATRAEMLAVREEYFDAVIELEALAGEAVGSPDASPLDGSRE
jgi:cobalt-zinc-cadmium resistance protein CzcA